MSKFRLHILRGAVKSAQDHERETTMKDYFEDWLTRSRERLAQVEAWDAPSVYRNAAIADAKRWVAHYERMLATYYPEDAA